MADGLDKLERAVERQMDLLAGLPPVTPDPRCLARVKDAAAGEALRWSGARAGWGRLPGWVSAAACLVLALGLSQVLRSPMPARLPAPSEGEWVDILASAVGESSATLGFLLDEGWLLSDAGGGADGAVEIDRLLESFERSFDQLGTL